MLYPAGHCVPHRPANKGSSSTDPVDIHPPQLTQSCPDRDAAPKRGEEPMEISLQRSQGSTALALGAPLFAAVWIRSGSFGFCSLCPFPTFLGCLAAHGWQLQLRGWQLAGHVLQRASFAVDPSSNGGSLAGNMPEFPRVMEEELCLPLVLVPASYEHSPQARGLLPVAVISA